MCNMIGQNAPSSKIHNRALVYRLIYQNKGISRKELSVLSKLSKASISGIIDSMMELGIVMEKMRDNKAKSIYVVPDAAGLIAVYIGMYRIVIALLDMKGNIIKQDSIYEELKSADISELNQQILKTAEGMKSAAKGLFKKLLGIGVAAPGAFEFHQPHKTNSDFRRPFRLNSTELKQQLEKGIGLRVYLENRSSLAALAEQWFGAGKNYSNFIQYSIGLGIGGGAVINNRLYRGNNNVVCEIGHTTVDYKGEQCFCGNRGCLDTVGSMRNLLNIYRTAAGLPQVKIEGMRTIEIATEIGDIFYRFEKGDTAAITAIEELSQILGIGAVSLINIFNPECIIISSNDIGQIDISFIVDQIEKYVRNRAYSISAVDVDIRGSLLGENIHLKGILAMALDNFAQNSFIL